MTKREIYSPLERAMEEEERRVGETCKLDEKEEAESDTDIILFSSTFAGSSRRAGHPGGACRRDEAALRRRVQAGKRKRQG